MVAWCGGNCHIPYSARALSGLRCFAQVSKETFDLKLHLKTGEIKPPLKVELMGRSGVAEDLDPAAVGIDHEVLFQP